MEDLIKALQILNKYANNDNNPTHCEHDVMMIGAGIELEDVNSEDLEELENLGFFWSDESFISYRFGSC